MTSQTELLTLEFLFFLIFQVSNSMIKKNNIILELVTRDFKEKKISGLLTQKIKNS